MFFRLFWIVISYLSGALPLSLWIGRLAAGVDIRQVGDGNPGATNVLRAAGRGWGLVALCADASKAAVPVGLAYQVFGWRDWTMIPIALAPAVGHAFTPFLAGKGGKALASILGTWIGLTLYEVPAVLLVTLTLAFLLIKGDGWVVLLTAGTGLLYLLIFDPNPRFVVVMVLQIFLVIWTHRTGLNQKPLLRGLPPSLKKSG